MIEIPVPKMMQQSEDGFERQRRKGCDGKMDEKCRTASEKHTKKMSKKAWMAELIGNQTCKRTGLDDMKECAKDKWRASRLRGWVGIKTNEWAEKA
jgi:uncharacterized protein YidB (DUF937 family)